MIDPIEILTAYYPPHTKAHHILVRHSQHVAEKALSIARHLCEEGETIDLEFIHQAAMLHDIGIFRVHAPALGCYGQLPYLHHGVEGAKLLRAEGLPQHAGVCERHTGVGLTAEEIDRNQLGLPVRDMVPTTLEEQIIAYADLFFSKNPQRLDRQRSAEKVRKSLCKFGEEKGVIFDRWQQRFHS
nr:HD domain-containing protein [uncultured Desulfuromonas sp.]